MLAKTKIPIVIASWDDIAEVDKNLIRQDVLCNKQEDSWECGYYVMSWIRTIIQAVAKNEWIERFSFALIIFLSHHTLHDHFTKVPNTLTNFALELRTQTFATLPPILLSGTATLFLLDQYPHVILHDWELNLVVVLVARDYFKLGKLERESQQLPLPGTCLYPSSGRKGLAAP
ncbi:hypothetical protein DEO72_LG6g756 [Vigna unguiculata]|uniref:Uncharacterized protein n=1 Tax=Vigna unguiculata TaxID=3917 RepID=A0A4D6M873_VIGUN|nr:hypothetical protein DEO72_LG6g756 [Vigna unguiculata]